MIFIIYLLLFPAIYLNAVEGRKIKFSNKIEKLAYLKTRLIIDVSELRFYSCLTYPRNFREEGAELRLGFSFPPCVAGPLLHEGLMQELQSPLSYSPSSAVFNTPPGTRLDSSMNPTTREGFGFIIIPVAMNGFAYKSRDLSFACGIEGRLSPVDCLSIDYLFSYSLPKHKETDSWFDRDWIYPGGDLFHLGGRVYAEGDYYGLGLSGGLSAADRAGPGCFVHLLQMVNLPFLELRHLFSYVDMGYLSCKGAYTDDLFQTAALLSINPVGKLNIYSTADWKLSRAEVSEADYLPHSLGLSVEAELSLDPFRAGLLLEKDFEWDEEGGEDIKDFVELEIGLCAAPLDCSISGSLFYCDKKLDNYSLALETEASLDPLSTALSLSIEGEKEEMPSCEGSFEIGLETEEGEGKLGIETLRGIPLGESPSFFKGKTIWDIITVSISWTVTALVN